jgi:hypothetical protein
MEGLGKSKKFNDIGAPICDLLAWSIVPQPLHYHLPPHYVIHTNTKQCKSQNIQSNDVINMQAMNIYTYVLLSSWKNLQKAKKTNIAL